MKASDRQEGGKHYKDFPIQPAEFCQRNRLNWCEANVVKYVSRHRDKKGAEDIRKAIHYLELLLEWEYSTPLPAGEGVAYGGIPTQEVTPWVSIAKRSFIAASQCPSCARSDCAAGQYPATNDGGCEGYVSALRENMLDAKHEAPTAAFLPTTHTDPSTNCKDCGNTDCNGIGRNLTCDQGCERFIPKELAHDKV